jgi:PAS domain S-box-containing protein
MFRQVLNAITDMVLVKGPGSKLEWANDAFLEAYGMTNEQLRGLVDAPFVEPDYTQQYVQDDQKVFDTGRPLDIVDEPMTRHDGTVMSCHTVKSPIFNDEGKVIKTVGVIRDISERKRFEVELRQSQRLESVGRMASGIAHEINTPIQFVGDQTQFLHTAFKDLLGLCERYRAFVAKAEGGLVTASDFVALREAEVQADLEFITAKGPAAFDAILEGTGRVAKLVQAMKEFGHPDNGQVAVADINRALKTTLVIAANELKYVADVETDYGELPPVRCQIAGLNQVFLNILVNAAHAIADAAKGGPDRGRIKVKTRRVGDAVVISISDTGAGIPLTIQSRIFDPFFTTKEVGRGTGQGLAIARMIVVEKHKGTLTFETNESWGSTFHVTLPIAGV